MSPANRSMWDARDKRRRWFGLFFLLLAALLFLWGQTVLAHALQGILYLAYWMVCFGFTFLAMATALRDFWIVRKKFKRRHRDMAKEVFGAGRLDRSGGAMPPAQSDPQTTEAPHDRPPTGRSKTMPRTDSESH